MNPFEMVVLIVAIVMVASIFKSRHRRVDSEPARPSLEAEQLREEVQRLKERVQTLERITVEKENSLAREIEDLRSRP